MVKYKVGDVVTVRSDLEVRKMYGKITFLSDMEKLKGKKVTISEVHFEEKAYRIKELNYWYDEAMFIGLAKDMKESVNMLEKLEVGMTIQLKDELDAGIKVYPKGTLAEVKEIKEDRKLVNIKVNGDLGVFRFDEIDLYFEEYVEPKQIEEKAHKPELGEDDISRIIQSENAIVVFLTSGAKGVAKCHNDDEYDFEVGKRVAYLKAKIQELNNELATY